MGYKLARLGACAIALIAMSACSGGGDTDTITPPEPPVATVSLTDAASVLEGGPGETATLTFPLSLNLASPLEITVNYTVNGTAGPSVVIPAASGGGSITVAREGDDVRDGDETVTVSLTSVNGGELDPANNRAIGVITDDEQRTTDVFYEVSDVGVVEAEELKDTLSGAWGFVTNAAASTKPGAAPSQAATGQTGEGYLFWDPDMPDVVTDPGQGVLGFQIAVDQSDAYVLSARMRRPADATEEPDASDAALAENTIWVRVLDANENVLESADAANPTDWAILTLSPAPRGEWLWASKIDVDGALVDAAWNLEADETYTVEVSGRSENVQIDRLHLSRAVANTDETLAESPAEQPANIAPTVSPVATSTAFDTAVALALVGADIDGVVASYAFTQPANGALSGAAPSLTYTPTVGFEGADSFTYTATDNDGATSVSATVSITVEEEPNVAPTAADQSVEVPFDTPTGITLAGSDPNFDDMRDGLTFALASGSGPGNGTLSGELPNLTYTPDDGYVGGDGFEFTVTDSDGATDIGVVVITVLPPPNVVPVAVPPAPVAVSFQTPAAITLSGIDEDGTITAFTVVQQPANGTLSGTGANRTYTPNDGFLGSDSFAFTVTDDDDAASTPAIVQLNVTNEAPTADAQSVTVAFETATTITLTGDDAEDGGVTSFTVENAPSNGALNVLTGAALTNPSVIYTPGTGFNGQDSFTFTTTDEAGATSAVATVSITVTNDAPVANAQSIVVAFNTPTSVTLTGSDPDGAVASFDVASTPSNGALSGTAPNLTYTPTTGFSGADSFTFTVTDDGGATSAAATVSIMVTNQAPTANAQSVNTAFNTPVGITLTGSDSDGAIASFDVVNDPDDGDLSGSAPNLTYTPDAGFSGSDTFTFTVTDDGGATSSAATVTITVTNQSPTATAQSVNVDFQTATPITLAGTDPDGAIASYTITNNPDNGVLSGSGANRTYTPNSGYSGADSFAFTVTDDGGATSSAATVSITVGQDPTIPPIANPQSVPVAFNTATPITLTGQTTNGTTVTSYQVAGGPTNGVLSGVAPNVTYTPNAGYSGADSFTFTVTNNLAVVSTAATVSITVTNDTPTATAQSVNVLVDTPTAITLAGTDTDGVITGYTVTAAPTNGVLSGVAPNITYTPNTSYVGADSFAFTVTDDGGATSAAASVSITVSSSPPSSVTISGKVSYERVPFDVQTARLEPSQSFPAPSRGVVVQARDAANKVVDSTVTDERGSYALTVPAQTDIEVVVLAKSESARGAQWDVEVRDNTNGLATYGASGGLESSGVADSVRDYLTLAADQRSGPWAILDDVYSAVSAIAAVDPDVDIPELQIAWSRSNRTASGSIAAGDIGEASYAPDYQGSPTLFLLGKTGNNTDEFDTPVIQRLFGEHLGRAALPTPDGLGASRAAGVNAFSTEVPPAALYWDTQGRSNAANIAKVEDGPSNAFGGPVSANSRLGE